MKAIRLCHMPVLYVTFVRYFYSSNRVYIWIRLGAAGRIKCSRYPPHFVRFICECKRRKILHSLLPTPSAALCTAQRRTTKCQIAHIYLEKNSPAICREEVAVTCARAVSFVIHFCVDAARVEKKVASARYCQSIFPKWIEKKAEKNGIQSFPTSAWVFATAAASEPENQCARKLFGAFETMEKDGIEKKYQFVLVRDCGSEYLHIWIWPQEFLGPRRKTRTHFDFIWLEHWNESLCVRPTPNTQPNFN